MFINCGLMEKRRFPTKITYETLDKLLDGDWDELGSCESIDKL